MLYWRRARFQYLRDKTRYFLTSYKTQSGFSPWQSLSSCFGARFRFLSLRSSCPACSGCELSVDEVLEWLKLAKFIPTLTVDVYLVL